jgi:hypothetical protein
MKTLRTLLVIAIAIFGSVTSSFAQQSTATAQANATAKIITPIAISKVNDMVFGTVAASAAGGTVVLSTAGARSATGVGLGVATGVMAAQFTVTGDNGAAYSVTLPDNATVTLTSANAVGETPMAVTDFTKSTAGTLTGGTETFTVGATLHLNAAQAQATDYTGTFNVTVNYN